MLLVGVLTILFYSCSQETTKEQNSVETEITKTNETISDLGNFESDTTYNFEVQNPSPDTFKLVSHSWYFWHPYGEFKSPKELENHYNRFKIEREITPSDIYPSEQDTLYRLRMNKGFIKFYYTTQDEGSENNDMTIVSAKVTEPVIQMTNGLKVGLTRDKVKEILFSKGEPANIRNYNNILIATVLDGVWVHLKFEGDKLTRITIDTDYQLNKE